MAGRAEAEAWTASTDSGCGGGGRTCGVGGRSDDAWLERRRSGWSEVSHGFAVPGPRSDKASR